MSQSKIEWTESTWNPVTGCTKINEGCLNCYAERMVKRLHAMGQPNYINGFRVTCHPHTLKLPLRLKKPRMIFVNSMSDLFHEKVSYSYIKKVFSVMHLADQHVYQILTKRAKRLEELSTKLKWDKHVWMGVTVKNRDTKFRIEHLRGTQACVKFLSCEPLLESLGTLDLTGIDWVIVGGESGPRARLVDPIWVREIRDQCIAQEVPFFFKQWGGGKQEESRTDS